MKRFILIFALISSWSLMAKTYECQIASSDLGRLGSSGMDMDFEVVVSSHVASLSILGDSVDQDCEVLSNTLNCSDAEGMPYTLRILSDTSVTLEIGRGMYLSETQAQCTSY